MLFSLAIETHTWQSHSPVRVHYSHYTSHCAKNPVTTMLTYPWKCTVLHCNHLGNTWKPLVLMTRHFDYCPSTSEGDNQSVRSSAPVVSRCFPDGYNVKLYISRGRLAWWLLAFLHSEYADILSRPQLSTFHSTKYPSWLGSRSSMDWAVCMILLYMINSWNSTLYPLILSLQLDLQGWIFPLIVRAHRGYWSFVIGLSDNLFPEAK